MVRVCVAEEKELARSGCVPKTFVYNVLTSWIDQDGNLWYPTKPNDVKKCLENGFAPSDNNSKIQWMKVTNEVNILSSHDTLEEARKRMLRYMEKGKSPEDVSTDPAEYGRGKRPKKAADHSYPGENDTSSKSQSNSSDDSDQQSTPDSPITTKKVARRPQQLVPPLVPVSKPIIPDFVSSDNDIYGGDEESAQRIDHSPVFRPRLSPTLFVESGKRSLTNSKASPVIARGKSRTQHDKYFNPRMTSTQLPEAVYRSSSSSRHEAVSPILSQKRSLGRKQPYLRDNSESQDIEVEGNQRDNVQHSNNGSSFARQHDSPIVNNSQKKSQQRRQLDFRDNDESPEVERDNRQRSNMQHLNHRSRITTPGADAFAHDSLRRSQSQQPRQPDTSNSKESPVVERDGRQRINMQHLNHRSRITTPDDDATAHDSHRRSQSQRRQPDLRDNDSPLIEDANNQENDMRHLNNGSRFVGLHNTPTEHHSRTENIGGIRPLPPTHKESKTTGQIILEKLADIEKRFDRLEKKQVAELDEDFSFDKLSNEKDLDFVDEALRLKDKDMKLDIEKAIAIQGHFKRGDVVSRAWAAVVDDKLGQHLNWYGHKDARVRGGRKIHLVDRPLTMLVYVCSNATANRMISKASFRL